MSMRRDKEIMAIHLREVYAAGKELEKPIYYCEEFFRIYGYVRKGQDTCI